MSTEKPSPPAEHGPITPHLNVVPVSGDFLAQERALNALKTSNAVPIAKGSVYDGKDEPVELHVHGHGPGTAPEHVYEANMSWWRFMIRRFLVSHLHAESRWIAAMQKRVRTPWLDTYFVYTSSLGTHTFFMTLLPALYFFGAPSTGRAVVQVLAAGVYFSSLVKDLICSPRPFAPPVTRLTMGNHHLEYGFPSTHSTNSVSMALYLYTLLLHHWNSATATQAQALLSSSSGTFEHFAANATTTANSLLNYQHEVPTASVLRPGVFHLATLFLCIYAISIVYGRVYCAMHSFTDCVMGITLGTAIWAVQWMYGEAFEQWMTTPGWTVPVVVIAIVSFLVNQHAEPVDDCPCFEDAIAFVSVVIGTTIGHWHGANWGYSMESAYFVSKTPGWEGRDISDWAIWLSFASLKMVVGVLIIVAWRILAKSTMHAALPPLFRGLARLFTLPHRRFYTPATDYKGPVPESEEGTGLLRSIPSVIDIPHMLEELDGEGRSTTSTSSALLPRYALAPQTHSTRSRNGGGNVNGSSSGANANGWGSSTPPTPQAPSDPAHHHLSPASAHVLNEKELTRSKIAAAVAREHAAAPAKHYDADVITKVVVYAGIGLLGSHLIPILFEELGWGVRAASGR